MGFTLLLFLLASDGITPISGVDPNLSDLELSPLSRLARSSKIIAIGESVHGSSRFLKMEHRLTRFLVERHGYRTLILENPVIRSEGLSEWVKACATRGALSEALTQGMNEAAPPLDLLYEPVEEDLAFLKWVCEFNRAHPDRPIVRRPSESDPHRAHLSHRQNEV